MPSMMGHQFMRNGSLPLSFIVILVQLRAIRLEATSICHLSSETVPVSARHSEIEAAQRQDCSAFFRHFVAIEAAI